MKRPSIAKLAVGIACVAVGMVLLFASDRILTPSAATPTSTTPTPTATTPVPAATGAETTRTNSWNQRDKVVKTDAEWRKQLTPEQFRVLREHGTERAFTGPLWNNKKTGVYHCAGCDLELFASDTKFDSGTGWPSYYQPILAAHVGTKEDNSFFMRRTEVHCARCEGHLGHVFDDGPKPTGLRYCINSASLTFRETAPPAPAEVR